MASESTTLFLRYRERGDLVALGRVFDALAPRLLGLALHLTGGGADAEDLVQRTFLVAMEKAHDFDAGRALEPWLTGILTGEARNAARRLRRQTSVVGHIDDQDTHDRHTRDGRTGGRHTDEGFDRHALPGGIDTTARAIEHRELVRLVRLHVDALPHEQRQVVLLKLQHGLRPAEISEVLGIPPGAVRMRLHRGLHALRGRLPKSWAPLLAVPVPHRGLDLVRSRILDAGARHAASVPLGSWTAIGTGGALMIQKVILVCAGLALLFFAGSFALDAFGTREPVTQEPSASVETSDGVEPVVTQKPIDAQEDQRQERTTPASPTTPGRIEVLLFGSDRTETPEPIPIPSADVVLWREASGDEELEQQVLDQKTDAQGRVVASDLAPATYRLEVQVGRESVRNTRIVLESGAQHVERVPLRLAGSMHGVVVDAGGNTIGGAAIHVGNRLGYGTARNLVRQVSTSHADGSFEFWYTHRDEYVAASLSGHAPSLSYPLQQLGGGAIRLVLGSGHASITGMVVDDLGAAIPNATVIVQHEAETFGRNDDGALVGPYLPSLATTDAAGRFEVGPLPPGRAKCSVVCLPWTMVTEVIDIEAGALVTKRFVLARRATIYGRIRDASGRPLPRMHVGLRQGRSWMPAISRDDGSYRFEGVKLEPFFLQASHGPSAFTSDEMEHPTPTAMETRVDLVMPRALAIFGTLVDAKGRGLANFRVEANPRGLDAGSDEKQVIVTTHDGGEFAIYGVSDREYTVRALLPKDGATTSGAPLAEVVANPAPTPLRIVVEEPVFGEVHGRVLDDRGQPIPGCSIGVFSVGGLEVASTTTDERGAYRIDDLPRAQLRTSVTSPDHQRTAREFDLRAKRAHEQDFHLKRAATLRVTYRRPDGSAWKTRPPVPWIQSGPGMWLMAGRVRYTLEGDEVVVRHVPAGHYTLVAPVGDELLIRPEPVDLAMGETRTITLVARVGRRCKLSFDGEASGSKLTIAVRSADAAGTEDPFEVEATKQKTYVLEAALPRGPVRITARSDAGETFELATTVRAGAPGVTQTIVVPRR